MKQTLKKITTAVIAVLLTFLFCTGVFAADVKNGLIENATGIHFYSQGKKLRNTWKVYRKKKYYFDRTGTAVTGAGKVGNKYYLFDEEGVLQQPSRVRMINVGIRTYCVNKDGSIKTGFFLYKNNLYYGRMNQNGNLAKDRVFQNVTFNSEGIARRNITAKVKIKALQIVNSITRENWSDEVKLKACWNYITHKGGFRYYAPFNPKNVGKKCWQQELALQFLSTKRGTCTGFAAGFAALADVIGYDSKIIRGKVPSNSVGMTAHSWITIGGKHYDPDGEFEGFCHVYASRKYPLKHEILRKFDYRKYV